MKAKEKNVFGCLLLFFFACLLLVSLAPVAHGSVCKSDFSADQSVLPEFKDTPAQYDLSIESSNFVTCIAEVYRLTSMSVLINQVVPADFNFSSVIFIPLRINFAMLVPIFIRVRSLRN